LRASLRHRWDAPHTSTRPHQYYPQAPADSCRGLQSRTRHAPADRHRHAARTAGSPGDRHGRAFGAPARHPTLAGRDFRMAPTHRGCAQVSVTDHYHRQLLSGDHLHHGLLSVRLPIERLIPLAIAKISASSISLGCGAPGGMFGPIFFIGAMTGGSFRRLSTTMFPRVTGPRGSYALVGLGAFLAGTTHTPLTAVFLLFEMTREYQITLPALLSCVLSLVVARSLEPESIDTYPLAREGKSLHIGKERRVLTQIPVSTVMSKEPITLSHTDDLTEVLRVAGETAQLSHIWTQPRAKGDCRVEGESGCSHI